MLLYKIIPDEFSAFQRLRPTPVGDHIPEWRARLSVETMEEKRAAGQEPPSPPGPEPVSPPGAKESHTACGKQDDGPEPEFEYDFTSGDDDLGMVEKPMISVLGEDMTDDG